jgi:hypothetical protein
MYSMSDNDSGFTVKDKRHFSPEGEPLSDQEETGQPEQAAAQAEPEAPAEPAEAGTADQAGPEARGGRHGLPPVDFSGFILSLSHAALMHMGQAPDPQTGQAVLNLDLARHTIDTIAMLQDKTKGNLDQDEQRLMDNALSQLRMIFVQAAGEAKGGPQT